MTFADNLSAVLDAACPLDINTRSTYQKAINAYAVGLEELFLESKTGEEPTKCATLECGAAQLVFGTSTITPGSSNYTLEQQGNWYEL